ncbi:MAG: CvpA family protein [Synergistaceae bacterium]|nr:CvpA family protein [Synergistaceae bacterium]
MGTAQLFDIAAALILVTLGFIGFLRGFVGAIMSFVSFACGTYFAIKFSGEGTVLFLKYFPDVSEAIANIAAFALIFLVVAIVVSLITRLLCSIVRFAKLSGVNHLAGLLIGLLTGFVLIVIAYGAVMHLTPEAGRSWVEQSIFMNLAGNIWPHVDEFLKLHGWDKYIFRN